MKMRNPSVEGQLRYGLLGSSGCGKSTVLSCIIGLQKWESGTITVFGDDVRHGVSRRNIGYMPQDYALYPQLTWTEMLQFYAKLHTISHTKLKERVALIESLLKLDGYGSRRICTLSGGETRRISLALTMIHDPELLILDEPTVGLDPLLREKIWNYLFQLTFDQKTTIIITTHYIEEVKYAHMVGIMRRGTLLAEESPKLLMQHYETTLLEDVVLEICKLDSLTSRQNTTLTPPAINSITFENEETDGQISRKITGVEDKQMGKGFVEALQVIWEYNKVIWIHFLRQPIFIIILLVLPPIQILTTGFVVGMPPINNKLGVVNKEILYGHGHENSSNIINQSCNLKCLSCSFVGFINSSIYLKMSDYSTPENARQAVERGDIVGYIEIPRNFSLNIFERAEFGIYAENATIDGTIIKLNLDMSDTIISYSVIKGIYEGFAQFEKELSQNCNIDLRRLEFPLDFRNPVYGNENVTVRDYMLSALIMCIVFEVSFTTAPLILINDMDTGMFERSQTAGLKLWEVVTGIFLAITTITVIQAMICFITVIYVLDFSMQGTIWAFILLCLVTAFCNGALGLTIGIWLKDILAIILTAIFLFPVLAVHSGAFRVLEIVPYPFRTLVFYLIPNVSITKPLRWIMSRGVGLTHPMVWPGVLVTVGWGLAFIIVCVFLLRRL